MKSIYIVLEAASLSIPLSYHHQVQSLIYSMLANGGGGQLHERSFDFGLHKYKLFTFSSLRGSRVLSDKKMLYFKRYIYLDIRSIRSDFCEYLLKGLESGEDVKLFNKSLKIASVKTSDYVVTESKIRIKMLSPLTLHKTLADGYTYYINPLDADFNQYINDNFYRKYSAFYGNEPSGKIGIKTVKVGSGDRYLTLYKKGNGSKDIYITAWRGEYELSAAPEYLNFLYYCGIGAGNSEGFGMFEIL